MNSFTTASQAIPRSAQSSNSIQSNNNGGGFPTLFSDEEFADVQLQLHKRERLFDGLDKPGVQPKPARTDGLPESTIEQRFSHVSKQLVAMWPSQACALYINRLVISDRAAREGFPQDVIDDLMMLYQINDMRCEKAGNNSLEGRTKSHTDVSKATLSWNLKRSREERK